jgi:hypothetical protein
MSAIVNNLEMDTCHVVTPRNLDLKKVTTKSLMDVILALLQLVVKQNLRLVPLLEGRDAVAGSRAQDVLRRQEKFLKNSITIRIKQLQVSAASAQCYITFCGHIY